MTEPGNSSALQKQSTLISNNNLHYYSHFISNTEPIILVHGIGVSSRYMLPLAEELAQTNTVYAIDLPGFGKSPKPDGVASLDTLADSLIEFTTNQSITNPIFVGNSFGCQVIIKSLKKYPGVASRAILIGPTMNIYERRHLKQIGRWLHNLKYEPTKKLSWILIKDIWQCGLIRVFKTLHLGIKDRPEEGLGDIKIPILWVRGELDPIAPTKWLNFLADHSNKFKTATLPKAGHALNFNSPKPLARIIKEFINSKTSS